MVALDFMKMFILGFAAKLFYFENNKVRKSFVICEIVLAEKQQQKALIQGREVPCHVDLTVLSISQKTVTFDHNLTPFT